MLELIALAGLVIAGLAVFAVVGVVFFVLKLLFWTIFLPFRLLMKLLWLPVGLAMGALGLAAGAAVLPILLVVGLAVAVLGAIAAILALLVPAIPFILLGFVVWAIVKARPAYGRSKLKIQNSKLKTGATFQVCFLVDDDLRED